jgi:acetyl esterase/lipase
MGLGRSIDHVAGRASRLLHGLRGPKHNTVPDLGPYLDRPAESFFPEPPALRDVRTHGSRLWELLRTTTLSWPSHHDILCPRYRERYERDYRAIHTVIARWLRPEGTQRAECLLYIHGWLEPGSWLEEAFVFPRWTRELGVDVLHVALPFHGTRNPKHALFSGEYFWTADLVRSFEGIRQAIWDVRSALSWLRSRGYQRVGVAGVSLGASLAMVTACLAPTPDYVVPICGHLRLGEAVEEAAILWRMKHDLERWGVHRQERERIFERVGFHRYLPVLAPRKQLWIEAREDGHIDPALVRAQWEDWGRPNLHWIPGGHMTFPTHLAEISREMQRFRDGL